MLRLGEGTDFQGESELALQMAYKLMNENGISMEQVTMASRFEEKVSSVCNNVEDYDDSELWETAKDLCNEAIEIGYRIEIAKDILNFLGEDWEDFEDTWMDVVDELSKFTDVSAAYDEASDEEYLC